ncbi:hypothetical protein HN789_04690 [archaeon]|jgi:hypothetical protein|nr:hypothetical protein [archaeon]MBT4022432.1 hypothetical protein [archaeon]MBT4272586.1 hypothetical protein [archaeon]MBT4461247.1 hypothetical protein [archaeon]MBT5423966.1 hypothetical protein [archaeon]
MTNKEKLQDLKKYISSVYSKKERSLILSAINNYEKKLVKKSEIQIPVSIFSQTLTPFETIVKYLYENHSLNFSKIGKFLGKDRQVIWLTYKRSTQKKIEKFSEKESKYFIPLTNLFSKNLSIAELVVFYLKKNIGLKNIQIASLLKRDSKTIWTHYSRALKKKGTKKSEIFGTPKNKLRGDSR